MILLSIEVMVSGVIKNSNNIRPFEVVTSSKRVNECLRGDGHPE